MKNLTLYSAPDASSNLILVRTLFNYEDFKSGIRVFCAPPYNEQLTEEDCQKEFQTYLDNGIVFGCYVNGELAGLNCILNDVNDEYSIRFPDRKKVAYYAGLAVKEPYRRRGLGKILVASTEKYLEDLGELDYSFARILCKGSMSEGIFRQNNFEDAYFDGQLIVDDVTYDRNDPNVNQTDKRKYMVKKLNPNAQGVFIKQ